MSASSLDSVRGRLDVALALCRSCSAAWPEAARDAAAVAREAAAERSPAARDPGLADAERYPAWLAARAFGRVAGLCESAARGPARRAAALLEEARRRLG